MAENALHFLYQSILLPKRRTFSLARRMRRVLKYILQASARMLPETFFRRTATGSGACRPIHLLHVTVSESIDCVSFRLLRSSGSFVPDCSRADGPLKS